MHALPPDAIAGIASRRARPGDIITFYEIALAPSLPPFPPARSLSSPTRSPPPFTVSFRQRHRPLVKYDGLAPNYVGLYQFNVVVPDVAASDAVPLTFSLNGAGGTQSLSIAVGN